MKGLTLILAILFSTPTFAEVVRQTFDAKTIKLVQVNAVSGNVEITGDAKDKATVVADKIRFDKGCKLNMALEQSTLVVTLTSPTFFRGKCQVRFNLSVPAASELDLKTGSGDILVEDVVGPVEFRTGSGDVEISGAPTRLTGRTGSGDITVNGLTTDAELKAGSGDISVNFAKIPESGRLQVTTGSGNTLVEVPTGAKVATDFQSGSGRLRNEVGDTPDAKFTIAVKAGSGDLHLSKAF